MSKEIKQNEALKPRTFNGEEVITVETSDDLISIAQRRLDTVKKIISIALKITTYRDWVNQNGNPYLVHSGAEKVARLFGVSLCDIKTEKIWADDTKGKYYIYKTTGKAILPGKFDSIEALGTCSQRDPFFGKANGAFLDTVEIDETNIMKASYSNFVVNSITHLLGLRNLTWEELKEVGIDKGKVQEIKYQSGSKKVEKTATADEIRKQKEIWDWLMQITGGSDELARERLKLESGFKSKDGDWIDGKKDPKYLTGKWLNITHRKIKEIFEKQFPQADLPIDKEEEVKK